MWRFDRLKYLEFKYITESHRKADLQAWERFINFVIPKLRATAKSGCKSLICPLYGGGSGNAHTVTLRPRTPKQRAFLFS